MRAWVLLLVLGMPVWGAAAGQVSFVQGEGRLTILIDGRDVATYVYEDATVLRPFFCQVKTLGGARVTRPHPPDPVVNKRNDDHEDMHPGLWLAFGDINGEDFWRNKGRVRHVRLEGPFEGPVGRFGVVNRYETAAGEVVCEEACQYEIKASTNGYVIRARSEFKSEKAFYFGDQEEMGFGMRLNTPLTVKFGSGEIRNSAGGMNEKGTWGKQAEWCAASGVVDGRRVGLLLAPSPTNFRESWFHSRDYGLVVANPFGKKAMTAPDDDTVAAEQTRTSELGFSVFVFDVAGDAPPDYAGLQTDYAE